jgi:hypothetical protein
MPEPLESELADATLESDALPQEDFPPGDVRRLPEAPRAIYILVKLQLCLHQASLQVPSEDPLIYEFERDNSEAPQPPASSGSQAAPTVTIGGVVGDPLQQGGPVLCVHAERCYICGLYKIPLLRMQTKCLNLCTTCRET